MKRFARMAAVTAIFVRKDWREFRTPIALVTAGLCIPMLLLALDVSRPDIARGMVAGTLMAAPFLYAQSCFYSERQHGTLDFLLALPLTPKELAVAKFASMFSMTLFTTNLPLLFLGNLQVLFVANAGSLFLSAVFMASTVVSDKPWAAQAPLWILMLVTLPFLRETTVPWIAARPLQLATIALILVPIIVWLACARFAYKARRY